MNCYSDLHVVKEMTSALIQQLTILNQGTEHCPMAGKDDGSRGISLSVYSTPFTKLLIDSEIYHIHVKRTSS